MACKRASDSHLCSLAVAYFSKHDNVGILTQKSAQCDGESQTYVFLQLHLADAFEGVFYRILNRHDIVILSVEFFKCRIEGGAFPGTGGPADQYHSVRQRYHGGIVPVLSVVETEFFERQSASVGDKQSEHYFLSVYRRHYRCSYVESGIAARIEDPSVLWQAFLRYVETGHYLYPVHYRRIGCAFYDMPLNQSAVYPESDAASVLHRLQMNVACVH